MLIYIIDNDRAPYRLLSGSVRLPRGDEQGDATEAVGKLVGHGLAEDVIRSGSFASVRELVADIKACLGRCNRWKAEGAAILEKSNAPAPPSTKSKPHELLGGN